MRKIKEIGARILKDVRNYGLGLFMAAVYVLAGYLLGISLCPMVRLTGLPCPGCGMTRAAVLFFQGHWKRAWQMHPFVYALPVLAVWAFASRYASGRDSRLLKWTVAALLVLSVAFYGYRMITVFPHRAPMIYEQQNCLGIMWNVCRRHFYGSCIIFLNMVN